jgi:hypothetical protein
MSIRLSSRMRAAVLHLTLSFIVAATAAGLVLGLWYPGAYRQLSGGWDLFQLIILVDVVLGPALTLVVFNTRKPSNELVRDLGIIAVIQASALGYGVYAVYVARPVALAFEIDRFRVVAAVDVREEELSLAPKELGSLSWNGPRLLGTRRPRTVEEQEDVLNLGFQGYELGQRPSYWRDYEASREDVLAQSRPVPVLLDLYPLARRDVEQVASSAGVASDVLRFLPVVARQHVWTALLGPRGDLLGFIPYDGFVQ